MCQRLFFAQRLWLVAVLAMVVSVDAVQAARPNPSVQKTFNKLLGAIQANDRNTFVADGTQAVKQGMTQQVMDGLNKQLGSRLKKGSSATYLTDLKLSGYQAYLWKVTFKDGGDDTIVRVVLDKAGKVAGFSLQ